jgi:hypothetical protein
MGVTSGEKVETGGLLGAKANRLGCPDGRVAPKGGRR